MSVLRLIEAARASGDTARLVEAMPYAAWLGLEPMLVDGAMQTRLRHDQRNIGNPSPAAIHGGVLAALLETAAIFHLLWSGETSGIPKIISISVDYLRPASPADTFACASVTRKGRRIANVVAEAWQHDRAKPVVSARMHFLLPETPGPKAPSSNPTS